jgi:hypothetical protein
LTFSSSPPDKRYINPLSITAITAITATYLITSAISVAMKLIGVSRFAPPLSPHQGRFPQSIAGAENTVTLQKNDNSRNIYMYLIVY